MKPGNNLFSRQWCEQIFDGRNKNYGAYFLRLHYAGHVIAGTILSVASFSLLVCIPFLLKFFSGIKPVETVKIFPGVTELTRPVDIIKKIPVEMPESFKRKAGRSFTYNFAAADSSDANDTIELMLANNTFNNIGDSTRADQPRDSIIDIGDPFEKNIPFKWVEIMPEFYGGEEAMRVYLQKRIVYPTYERELNIQGIVYLTMIISPDGSIDSVSVLRGVNGGPNLAAEAYRVVSKMPKWKPGMQNGKPVYVELTLPVNFVLR